MVNTTNIICLLLLTLAIFVIAKLHKQKKQYQNQINLLKEQIERDTLAFKKSNSKIEDYAYMNSHHVRGPLARILGMIHLIDIHSITAEDAHERIREAAVQLDDVIHLINISLGEQKQMDKLPEHDENLSRLKKLA